MAQEFGQYIGPLLAAIKKLGGSARPDEACEEVIKDMGLEGSSKLDETLKSGVTRVKNQIAWAREYLASAGYIDRSKWGVWTLTQKARNAEPLTDTQVKELISDVQRKRTKTKKKKGESAKEIEGETDGIPLGDAYKVELLSLIRSLPPSGFERLSQRLLRESGFERVEVTGRTGDGGIDGNGVLKINPLVGIKVLFQCKRIVGTVGSPVIRAFQGAIQGRADKGIVITTGTFSGDAIKESSRDGAAPVELIDGERLIELFANLELGLIPRAAYEIDRAFFEEFQ